MQEFWTINSTTLPFIQAWKWKQRSILLTIVFFASWRVVFHQKRYCNDIFLGASFSLNGKLKMCTSRKPLVIPNRFQFSRWIFGYPSSSLAFLVVELALAVDGFQLVKIYTSIEYTPPSFTWNLNMMLPKRNISHSRDPQFSGEPSLIFGELLCLSRWFSFFQDENLQNSGLQTSFEATSQSFFWKFKDTPTHSPSNVTVFGCRKLWWPLIAGLVRRWWDAGAWPSPPTPRPTGDRASGSLDAHKLAKASDGMALDTACAFWVGMKLPKQRIQG